MTQIVKPALLMAALIMLSAPVSGAENRPGRFSMYKADDGFVRLDTETGAMSLCQKGDQGWGCKPMSDSAAALRSDVERLTAENSKQRAEIKRMEELLGLRNGDRGGRNTFKLPTEEDVDQALNYFERMLKKFQDRLKRLERRDGDEPKRL